MEKKMETTIVYLSYVGRMEMNMETTIVLWCRASRTRRGEKRDTSRTTTCA